MAERLAAATEARQRRESKNKFYSSTHRDRLACERKPWGIRIATYL